MFARPHLACFSSPPKTYKSSTSRHSCLLFQNLDVNALERREPRRPSSAQTSAAPRDLNYRMHVRRQTRETHNMSLPVSSSRRPYNHRELARARSFALSAHLLQTTRGHSPQKKKGVSAIFRFTAIGAFIV